jgi:hypothetical protein
MADISTRSIEARILDVLTPPKEGSLRRSSNGDLVFEPGCDFADLVCGENRTVSFEYLRRSAAGSNVGTATVIVRGDRFGPVVEKIEYWDTRTLSRRFALDSLVSPKCSFDRCRVIGHPPEGSVEVGNGFLTFQPQHDFDDLMNGETRKTKLTCAFEGKDETYIYAVELTIEAGLHGIFVPEITARRAHDCEPAQNDPTAIVARSNSRRQARYVA